MTVAGRVAAGSVILLALLVSVLGYHEVQVRRLLAADRRLATVTFRAATVALALTRRVDEIEESFRKLLVTGDPGYAAKAAAAAAAIRARLVELTALDLSAREATEAGAFRSLWRAFPLATASEAELARAARTPGGVAWLGQLDDAAERLRLQAAAVFTASQAAVSEQVARSERTGEAVGRISLLVVTAAVLSSLLAVALTARSISLPLRRLREGTRAVAAGRFVTHLPDRGRDELAGLAQDFNAMVRRLGELDRLKTVFVSHLSHELKTPLVAMQETDRLLLEETVGPLNDAQKHLLGLGLQASARLSAMITELLDFSRLEAGGVAYRWQPTDLGELLARAAAELAVWAAEQGVRLAVDAPRAPLLVSCDGDRVVQVVQNLLDNATRLSPRGAVVRLAASRVDELPAHVLAAAPGSLGALAAGRLAAVSVLDRGPGIASHEREAVFERFRQLDTGGGRRGGVGLGLAICRQIVEDHGGAIWAADNDGGGSVLTFVLPLAAGDGDGVAHGSAADGSP